MSPAKVKYLPWIMMGHPARYINFSPALKANGQLMSGTELDTETYHLNRMGDEMRRPASTDAR
jgi:hypothetical protein